jgi:DtxR family transcriptional regulator, Mn-dependent transcriptional regulator
VNISNSEENYLKAIFHLQADTDKVNTNAVAEKLNTKPASVTDMMKRLSTKKLLDYQPYKGFSLSGEGKKIALGIVRRHRLWEYFLVEKLQLGWDEVHEIAEELEHVSSKRLIDKLDEYLGYPKFDPHGDPIPDSKGKLRRSNEILLLQLPMNQRAEVSRVGNQSVEMLELLQHKNIRIGTKIEVKNNFSFDGSIEVKVKNATVTISEQLAQNIFVTYES